MNTINIYTEKYCAGIKKAWIHVSSEEMSVAPTFDGKIFRDWALIEKGSEREM